MCVCFCSVSLVAVVCPPALAVRCTLPVPTGRKQTNATAEEHHLLRIFNTGNDWMQSQHAPSHHTIRLANTAQPRTNTLAVCLSVCLSFQCAARTAGRSCGERVAT
mmetsp:Transcript_22199/g.54627  ORF Transcript_22199/g.54627 Transcript_22199/m.54627 type:complete len:106 (-) Transcript_22199:394-711(-)